MRAGPAPLIGNLPVGREAVSASEFPSMDNVVMIQRSPQAATPRTSLTRKFGACTP